MTRPAIIEIPAPPRPAKRPVPPKGRVITFYSYKGGTGRSMALANVAWLLAMSGSRVLVIDWDLEAPGLHRYFHPFLEDKELLSTPGLLDYVENLAAHSASASEPFQGDTVDVFDYIQSLEWPRDSGLNVTWKQFSPGRIDILTAGRQGPAYARKLAAFNWVDFYERLHGRQLLNAAKDRLKTIYDYVLIDSRTGVSDTSGICTAEMPDTLVICFTLNHQSIIGASAIAKSVAEIRREEGSAPGKSPYRAPIRIFPVPTRVEITSERDKLRLGLETARRTFAPFFQLPSGMSESRYWGSIQMAYFPFYAFEEIPAVFGDSANQVLSLSTAIKQLTNFITNDEAMEYLPLAKDEQEAEGTRQKIVGWYLRRSSDTDTDAVGLAQRILDRLPPERQDGALSALARLVQIGEKSSLIAKAAPVRDLGKRRDLIEPLVQAKIAVVTEAGGSQTIAFSDAALVDRWSTLRDWVSHNWQFLILRQTLVAAIESWKLSDRDDERLLLGKLLAEAEAQAASRPEELNDAEHDFIRLSVRTARKASRETPAASPTEPGWRFANISWRSWVIGSIAAVVLIGLSAGFLIYRQRQLTDEQQRASKILEGAKQARDSDPLTAVLLLRELGQGPQLGVFREIAADLAANQPFPQAVFKGRGIHFVQWNRDGRLLAVVSANGTQIRDLRDNTVRNIPVHGSKVVAAAFDGWYPRLLQRKSQYHRVVTVSEDSRIQIWNSDSPSRVPLMTIDASVDCSSVRRRGADREISLPVDVRFSPDERTILVRHRDTRIALFSAETGKCISTDVVLAGDSTVLSPGGGVASVAFDTGRLERFRMDGQKLIPTIYGVSALFRGVLAVNCSGDRFVVDSALDNQVLFDTRTHRSMPFQEEVYVAAFDCREKLAGVSRKSQQALLFDVRSSPRSVKTFVHPKNIVALALDAEGFRLATATSDSVRVWALNRQLPPEGASWSYLISYLIQNTRACLSGDDRKKYLGEVRIVADQRAADCEDALYR